jgi:uncharacterized phage protein gp47/JayE
MPFTSETTSDRHQLDECGCCEVAPSLETVWNRPGLPSLAYRVGIHPTFLQSMLRNLPAQEVLDGSTRPRPLEGLGTRSTDDPTIALLDAWAVVADVLTFYQERIANEGFLRTARERGSVLELARAIGYELNPGVAASTHLAFTVDDFPGAAPTVDVPTGTKVQSVPGPGALPQAFETVDPLEARPEWNAIRPQRTEPWKPKQGDTSMYVQGVDTQLQSGDAILIVGQERVDHAGSEAWDVRILQSVQPDLDNDRTLLDWAVPPGLPLESDQTSRGPLGGRSTKPSQEAPRVYALRLAAALFGYNAPEWRTLPETVREQIGGEGFAGISQWPHFRIERDPPVVYLDAAYPKVLPGGWLVLSRPGWTELYRAELVSVRTRTAFSLSAKVTRVQLDTGEHLNFFGIRNANVLAQSEELHAVGTPKTDDVQGTRIVLDGVAGGLAPDQAIALTVERPPDQAAARPQGEVAVIAAVGVDADGTHTILDLREPLDGHYAPSTLLINANVARATHGETVNEVLGSGDATRANQAFSLKRPPLTYVSASTAIGAESTLTVKTDGIAWTEAPSLFGRRRGDQVYVLRTDDEGICTVTFGDGSAGGRLPSGQANIVATYRTGIGPDGAVAAGALTLLQTRPLGVRSVENPEGAAGAASPERLEDARRNAPMTVLTLDRMVSRVDYEDFVRSFAGIGKAQAAAIWRGGSHVVHVTVAAEGGDGVDPTSDLYRNLLAAIDQGRDPVLDVQVESFRKVCFHIRARVLIARDRSAEEVLVAVDTSLHDAFSFDRREFGQPVLAAEVIAAIQAVPGVAASDLQELDVLDVAGNPVPPLFATALAAHRATSVEDDIVPAELLLLADGDAGVALEVMVP